MEKEEKKVVKQELSEEELNEVAGGNIPFCDKNYHPICPQKRDTRGNICNTYVFR